MKSGLDADLKQENEQQKERETQSEKDKKAQRPLHGACQRPHQDSGDEKRAVGKGVCDIHAVLPGDLADVQTPGRTPLPHLRKMKLMQSEHVSLGLPV